MTALVQSTAKQNLSSSSTSLGVTVAQNFAAGTAVLMPFVEFNNANADMLAGLTINGVAARLRAANQTVTGIRVSLWEVESQPGGGTITLLWDTFTVHSFTLNFIEITGLSAFLHADARNGVGPNPSASRGSVKKPVFAVAAFCNNGAGGPTNGNPGSPWTTAYTESNGANMTGCASYLESQFGGTFQPAFTTGLNEGWNAALGLWELVPVEAPRDSYALPRTRKNRRATTFDRSGSAGFGIQKARSWFDDWVEFPVATGGTAVKYWNGTTWTTKPVKYWNGSAWVTKPAKRWSGSAWV